MINSTAVHELTRDHKTTIMREGGKSEYVDEMSLLEQLHQARTANRGTGGSSGGSKSPVSLAAVDLWNEIVATTNAHWPGYGRPHLARTPLGLRIQQWANSARGDEHAESTCNAWVVYWCAQIRQAMLPTVELDAPCPECGEKFLWVQDGEETLVKRALTFNAERVQCRGCGASWKGVDNMKHLSALMDRDA